jgi:uncharacterized protein
MKDLVAHKVLTICVDMTDTWKDLNLYEAIVSALRKQGIAGSTVISGIMGFGTHRHIHRKGLFGISDEKPVTIMAVDTEEKIRAVLPSIVPMVGEGLIMLQDAEVISMGLAAG